MFSPVAKGVWQVMKLRTTELCTILHNGETVDPTVAEIDLHLEEWANAGWDLVTVTSTDRQSDAGNWVAHKFFWRNESHPEV
jgi:hypothetical protein